ncbi:hypothetical protein PG985_009576 [Apiospora marii]|uniref:Uncharacterized protein n=1 Tax=Apiospora marii TaxID=335849 RepID=A0ABR1RFQ4_9PEZI
MDGTYWPLNLCISSPPLKSTTEASATGTLHLPLQPRRRIQTRRRTASPPRAARKSKTTPYSGSAPSSMMTTMGQLDLATRTLRT